MDKVTQQNAASSEESSSAAAELSSQSEELAGMVAHSSSTARHPISSRTRPAVTRQSRARPSHHSCLVSIRPGAPGVAPILSTVRAFPLPLPLPLPLPAPVRCAVPFAHENLDVYKLALDFLVFADQLIERLPRGRGHLADQLGRASTSIVLNLAEGAGKFSKPAKRRYYLSAAGSTTECAAILDVCLRLKLTLPRRTQTANRCSSASQPCW